MRRSSSPAGSTRLRAASSSASERGSSATRSSSAGADQAVESEPNVCNRRSMRAGPMYGTREIASQNGVSLSAPGDPIAHLLSVVVTLALSVQSQRLHDRLYSHHFVGSDRRDPTLPLLG